MQNIDILSVSELQQQLRALEQDGLDSLRKAKRLQLISKEEYDQKWQAICEDCRVCRKRLFDLTGYAYGEAPAPKPKRPDDDLLNAEYLSPEDIPPEVFSWVRSHASTLFSDASDAVRWARIVVVSH